MHVETSQLIALRDQQPVAAEVTSHIESCARCRLRLQEIVQMRDALRNLPEEAVPGEACSRIQSRLEQASTPRRRSSMPGRWIPAAVAAAVAAVAVGLLAVMPLDHDTQQPVAGGSEMQAGSLDELQQQSRELEQWLQRYRAPAVMSLRAADTYSELEDSIALIDWQLNAAGTDEREKRLLWQRRIALMESLLTVHATARYAGSI